MPRIRRWHPVSHDFVRDREAQELRLRFGHWMTDVWLEMLSEADKNKRVIEGDAASIAKGLAWVSLSDRPSFSRGKIFNAIEYMLTKGWLEEGNNGFLVRNYPEYHKTREQKESPEGTYKAPLLTSLPNELTKQPKKKQGTPSSSIDSSIQEFLQKTLYLKCLSNGKHGKYWREMEKNYDHYPFIYFEDEIKNADKWCVDHPEKRPTERGMPAFFKGWVERSVEAGRKKHGQT